MARTAHGFENGGTNKYRKEKGYNVDADAEEHGLETTEGVESTGVHSMNFTVFKRMCWIC